MWVGNKSVFTPAGKESLFNELYKEVKSAAPCSQLTYKLRNSLEQCDMSLRSELASRVLDGCSPLFVACKKGNVEIVEYLVSVCKANVEVKGLYEVQDDRTVHTVTPLWCAAVAGKLKVVEVLVKYGADVNAVSDTGSTPVRSACFMTHLDIVKLLVENGADIQKPNQNGGTCLINSVQSVELCEYLLRHGAHANAQDVQNKTALHYAIQEHRFETTKLLLRFQADPFLVSRYRDDALQTACLKGAAEIFKFLVDNVSGYSHERVASAFELLGSTFLDEHHDLPKALTYWKAACDVRQRFGILKPVLPAKAQYRMTQEFTSKQELEPLALDLDSIRTQSLLICERILGTMHKDMIYRLMYRGAAYADSLQYQHCIDLWKYALELRVAKDSILFCDTSFTAQALVKLYLDLYEKHAEQILNTSVQLEDVVSTIELLVSDLPECSRLLSIAPQYEKQQKAYDTVLKIITHLLHLVTCLHDDNDKDEEHFVEIRRRIHSVVHLVDPRTTAGDSLLHLSVMKNNTLRSQNLFEEAKFAFFPSMEVTKLLIECGAKINALNAQGNTPLHTASLASNYRHEIVESLLENGAHIDVRNARNERPLDMLKLVTDCKINPLMYLTLRCLAASTIARNKLPYKKEIPTMLEEFIEAH